MTPYPHWQAGLAGAGTVAAILLWAVAGIAISIRLGNLIYALVWAILGIFLVVTFL